MRNAYSDNLSTPKHRRTGLILPFVLMVIAFLALLGSGFSWMAQADYAAAGAAMRQVDARLAAESGLQRILALLSQQAEEFSAWYDNEEALGRQLIWVPGEDDTFTSENRTVKDLEEDEAAWVYSIVADDPDSDEPLSLRYGLTDEASKFHLNVISGEQMRRLITATVQNVEELDLDVLIDSLGDWRDADDDVRPAGAEKAYYESLRPPYAPTNARFRTVEELLMVRGFTAEVMWGEDQNRNGILDPNEDDGEANFPEDDADGELLRGIAPYLTVWSRELEASSTGQARVDINSANEAALQMVVSPEIASYIVAARAAGYKFASPADLADPSKAPAVRHPESGETIQNPVTQNDIPQLMDVLTASGPTGQGANGPTGTDAYNGLPGPSPDAPPGMPLVEGRININTAPAPVLISLGVFTPDDVTGIVNARREMDDEERKSLNWLTTRAGISPSTFSEAAPYLTTRAEQWTVESIGYATHLGIITRLQAVVEMRFRTVPYLMYFRDVTALGTGYPVHELLKDENEREQRYGRSK